ncbi:MAG TPA: hypothetical protein VFV41_06830 [Streptosporangiaceae bacterium]|nr:hypothetical protein [Streptosporangiaceae bacterium]
MTSVRELTEVFRAGRRHVRDLLPTLARALGGRDPGQARTLIAAVADATGPHFHYQGAAMYTLLADHHDAIRNAREPGT